MKFHTIEVPVKGESMKKIIYPILVLVLAMMACSIPTPVTPTEPPVVTEPPQPTEPPVVTNVTCNELALYLDPALASSYTCETVAESTFEMEMYPAHTKLTLQGYPLSGKFFEPMIRIYSVAGYTALLPDRIPAEVAELQAIIASGSIPPFATSFTSSLPFLPTFPAAQVFYAKEQMQPFQSGGGIRFLTEYAQYSAPVNNTDLFYTYQGLTADGQYWVSAILPVNNPILPADAMNPPGGLSWEEFTNGFDVYITDTLGQLNAQPPDSFTPTLGALDALVASITITP
jgi:hypothetical protein